MPTLEIINLDKRKELMDRIFRVKRTILSDYPHTNLKSLIRTYNHDLYLQLGSLIDDVNRPIIRVNEFDDEEKIISAAEEILERLK